LEDDAKVMNEWKRREREKTDFAQLKFGVGLALVLLLVILWKLS
jgi:hypothetical protein